MENLNFIEVALDITLASLGGIVRKLSELEKKPDQKVKSSHYAVSSFISMFVGIVVYLLCKNFHVSPFLTAGVTALSGYMGAPALNVLSDIVKKHLEKEIETKRNKGGENL